MDENVLASLLTLHLTLRKYDPVGQKGSKVLFFFPLDRPVKTLCFNEVAGCWWDWLIELRFTSKSPTHQTLSAKPNSWCLPLFPKFRKLCLGWPSGADLYGFKCNLSDMHVFAASHYSFMASIRREGSWPIIFTKMQGCRMTRSIGFFSRWCLR